jgi:hypothetical protein
MAAYVPTDPLKNAMLDAAGLKALYFSVHTGPPSTTGANEVAGGSYARKAVVWAAAAAGVKNQTGGVTFDLPATTFAYIGVFDHATLGGASHFMGYWPIGTNIYASPGTYFASAAQLTL